jgi:hypothetical protein
MGAAAGAAPELPVTACFSLPAEKPVHELAADENKIAVTLGILAQKFSVCGNLFQEFFLAKNFKRAEKILSSTELITAARVVQLTCSHRLPLAMSPDLVHSWWLMSPQLLNAGLRPLGWMGMPLHTEKLRQFDVEGRQNLFDSPNASQHLLVHDLLTRIRVKMLSVHDDT